ncbi:MAG: metallophosphoesterase [Bacteroidales bacterium]|nr:metallophosphoesterase [Bacteroidales bacterium]
MKKIAFLTLLMICTASAFAQEHLKIMTYNVRNSKGMDNVMDCRRAAAVIRTQAPDVVAVQELDSMTRRSGGKYILGEIADYAGMNAEYFPAIEFDGGKYGIGILSKEKPHAVKGYPLPGREEERALLVAEFEEYVFACTHLSLTEADRMASLETIGKIAKGCSKPFYLAGDLNDIPGSQFIKALQENFRILNKLESKTFPAPNPDRTLDYIAVWKSTAPKLDIVSKEVIDEPMASDHRPVVVKLRTALEANELMRTKPYLQNPTNGGMTIMWETIIPAYSWVEYGTDTTQLERARLLVDGQAEFNESVHKIRLEGLKPGVKYYYRVCSQEILYYGGYHKIFGNTAVSPFYSFVTAQDDADSFTALVFNDIHQRKHIFEALYRHVKDVDYDFVVFNGDCIDDPKDHNQASGTLKFLTESVNGSSIPTIFIRGNHEIRNAYSIGLRKHLEYAGGKTYSAFNWGDTRIVILDCGEDKKDDHREYSGLNDFTSLREEQVEFLKEELSSKAFKKADKRILFHHIPIYGMQGSNLCEPLWRPMLDKAPFDVAFNAHTHQYAFHPEKSTENNYPVFIGGGKSMDNATIFVVHKSKGKLSVKVINTAGEIMNEWKQ